MAEEGSGKPLLASKTVSLSGLCYLAWVPLFLLTLLLSCRMLICSRSAVIDRLISVS